MTKKQADNYLYQIYKMLRDTEIHFRLNRKLIDHGIAIVYNNDPSKGAFIEIDPEKREFSSSLLHEALHLLDWSMSETEVVKLEKALMRKWTDKQLSNFLKRFAEKL